MHRHRLGGLGARVRNWRLLLCCGFLHPFCSPLNLRVARLQNEVGGKKILLNYEISYERCSQNFLNLYFVGPKKFGRFQGVPEARARLHANFGEAWRCLANTGELWPAHNTIFTKTSPTFTRVSAQAPHVHQSSGEGAFCIWLAFRMCPNKSSKIPTKFPTPKIHQRASEGYHSNFLDYTSPFCFSGVNSCIISPPIAPNSFWRLEKRKSQEKLHHTVLSLLRKFTPFYTKIFSGNSLHQKVFGELIV